MTSKGVSNLSGGGVQFIAEKVFNSCGQSVHFGTEYAKDREMLLPGKKKQGPTVEASPCF